MKYVALLRGINVGGATMMKMTDLKAEFERLGFENVRTYINSGNIAFDAKKAAESKLINKIEPAIEKRFGRAVPVMVREQNDIERILKGNPFDGQYDSHKEMHVLFLKEEMPKDKEAELLSKQTENERFAVIGREIYCHLKQGVADGLLGKGYIEKKLKVAVTGRNWRTVQKLAEM
jgi:uncharacterized protein (DUF1697 family)